MDAWPAARALTFDYCRLYTDGTVTVAAAPTPEPTSVLLLAIGGMSLAQRRAQRRKA